MLRHDEVRAPSGLLRVIAADGGRAHGRTDTLMIGDEVWSWPEREPSLLDAFETALVKIADGPAAAHLDLGRPARLAARAHARRALAGEVKRARRLHRRPRRRAPLAGVVACRSRRA